MHRHFTGGGNDRLPLHPLRVHRVGSGDLCYVRTLSAEYGGLFTHYAAKRSRYCCPRDCPPALHKLEQFWKGYAAAEVWRPVEKHWLPVCLEITEHLELDFRGRFGRAQVWELSRLPDVKTKRFPVRGLKTEDLDPNKIPDPFDLVPCLLNLYHVQAIDLTARNPLPDKTMLAPSSGAPPTKAEQPAPPPAALSEDQLAKIAARAPAVAERLRNQQAGGNGQK